MRFFFAAAVFEIFGCYSAWMWLRLGRSGWWMVPGVASLVIFALILTRVDAEFAGRAFAAYGGIYIVTALTWTLAAERVVPRLTDIAGSLLCLAGAAVILFGARWTTGW